MKPTQRVHLLVCRACGCEIPDDGTTSRCPVDGRALVSRAVHQKYPLGRTRGAHLGRVIAEKYRLIDVIGRGGFAAVYRAIQEPVEREVAVKVIRLRGDEEDEGLRARFFREARTIGRLAHSATVGLYDYGEDDGDLYMVLEYVRGRTLKNVLRDTGRLTAERAVAIAVQILETLVEAHGYGIVHRDLKPENVMLVRSPLGGERVKVLDFGIAKILKSAGAGEDSVETRRGLVIGTPRYMAPEQAAGQVSPRSDLYAVGIVIYEMLTGAPPFSGDTPFETLYAHVTDPVPEMPAEIDAPNALRAAVRRALAKPPEERFGDAAAMVSALSAAVPAAGRADASRASAPPFEAVPDELPDDAIPTLATTMQTIGTNSLQVFGEPVAAGDAGSLARRPLVWVVAGVSLAVAAAVAIWFSWPSAPAEAIGASVAAPARTDSGRSPDAVSETSEPDAAVEKPREAGTKRPAPEAVGRAGSAEEPAVPPAPPAPAAPRVKPAPAARGKPAAEARPPVTRKREGTTRRPAPPREKPKARPKPPPARFEFERL